MPNYESTQHVIDVRLGEFLNIICPKYSINDANNIIEYHSLYQVSKEEYDTCNINLNNNIESKQILLCDKPFDNIKYTLYISQFSPVPNAPEFIPGNSYYFISTSNSSFNGLNNTKGGTCLTHNMRIILRVIDANSLVDINHRKTTNNNDYKITHEDAHKSQQLYSQSNSIHKKTSLINLLVTNTIKPLISNKFINKKIHNRPSTSTSSIKTTKDVILIRPDIDYNNNNDDDDDYYNVIVRLTNDETSSKLKIGDSYSASFYRQQLNSFKYLKSNNSFIIYCLILYFLIVKFKIS